MNEPQECLDITRRFFEALDMIKAQKRIRGMQTFSREYGENYWNFTTARKDGTRIKQEWLTYLVRDYDVSAEWLLTGRGGMFTKDIIPKEKFKRNSPKQNTFNNDTDKTNNQLPIQGHLAQDADTMGG